MSSRPYSKRIDNRVTWFVRDGVRCAGPADDSPSVLSDTETADCNLCWLHISHTRALHNENVGVVS